MQTALSNFSGQKVMAPGCACGEGLTTEAAELMGLMAGTPVASSIIDAHAGGIGKFFYRLFCH